MAGKVDVTPRSRLGLIHTARVRHLDLELLSLNCSQG
jgi:hypothetical protein